MKEKKCRCNGIMLNYMEHAHQGSSLLLLHGATNRWQSFMPIIPDLTHYFHLYALDFRGHGQSARAESYTLSDYLNDTHAIIQECIKEPVSVIGHSLGGMIGLLLAADYPDLIKQLVLIDTPLTLQSLKRLSSGPVEHANWLIQGLRYSQLLPGLPLPERLKQCDPEMLLSMVNQFDSTFNRYRDHRFLVQITCPVLLIRGSVELGSLITEADLKATQQLIPHLMHVKIEHAGHSPIRQDTQGVLQAIHSFIAT